MVAVKSELADGTAQNVRVSRARILLAIAASLFFAACTQPAPTHSQAPAGASCSVSLNVARDCGSASGCSYMAELDSAANKWQAQSVAGGSGVNLGPGLPPELAAGDYTLNFFVFALTSPKAQLGSCATDFKVQPTDTALLARVAVTGPSCEISITPST
jgi:hypothetical protein